MIVASKKRIVPQEFPLFDWLDKEVKKANPSGAEVQHRKPKPRFPGPAYDQEFDEIRLTGLQWAVYDLMKDGIYRTHSEIKAIIGRGSENGISAMLRNLRHKSRGKHTVNKRRRGNPELGLYEYQLLTNLNSRVKLKEVKK